MDSNKLKESIITRVKAINTELAQIDSRVASLREELQVQNGYLKMLNQLDGTEPVVFPKAPRPAGAKPLGRPRKTEAAKAEPGKKKPRLSVDQMAKLPFAIRGAELCARALETHGPLGFAALGRAAYPGRPDTNVWLAMRAKPEWFEQPGGRGTKWQLSEAGRNRPKVELPAAEGDSVPAETASPGDVASLPNTPQPPVSSPFPRSDPAAAGSVCCGPGEPVDPVLTKLLPARVLRAGFLERRSNA